MKLLYRFVSPGGWACAEIFADLANPKDYARMNWFRIEVARRRGLSPGELAVRRVTDFRPSPPPGGPELN